MEKRHYLLALACVMLSASVGCGDDENAPVSAMCTPGEMVCAHDTLKACIGYRWNEMHCPYGCDSKTKTCKPPKNSACAMDMCVPGSEFRIKRCMNGQYVEEDCPPDRPICQGWRCVSKTDVGECMPGEVRCSPDIRGTQVCGIDKKWKASVGCGFGKMCDPMLNRCVAEDNIFSCEPGSVRCSFDGKGTQTCGSDKKWGKVTKCDDSLVCDPNIQKCVFEIAVSRCRYGDIRCSDDRMGTLVCTGTRWSDPVSCGPGEVCDPDINQCVLSKDSDIVPASVCKPGERRCSPDLMGLQGCTDDGLWGPVTECSPDGTIVCDPRFLICNPAMAAECADGEQRCLDNGSYIRCDHGKWMPAVRCPDGRNVCAVIDGVGQCVDCMPGETRCTPNHAAVQVCTAKGKWADPEECRDGNICDPRTNACPCAEGVTYCTENGDYQKCVDGAFRTLAQCGGDEHSCSAGGCCDVIGEVRCNEAENKILTCTAVQSLNQTVNVWNEDPCDSGKCMEENGKVFCAPCRENDVRCDSAHIQKCVNGAWINESCDSGMTCDSSVNACVTECVPGEARCTDDGAFWVCLERMDGYIWVKQSDCGDKESCSSDSSGNKMPGCSCELGNSVCDKDANRALRCVEKSRTVRKGADPFKFRAWDVEACGVGSECHMLETYVTEWAVCGCDDGDVRCDGSRLQVCHSGTWMTNEICAATEVCDEDAAACVRGCLETNLSGWVHAEKVCSGHRLMKCENGVFVEEEKCDNGCMGSPSDGSASCLDAVCTDGMRRCSKDMKDIEVCTGGNWEIAPDTCKNGQICMIDERDNMRQPKAVCAPKVCAEREMGCSVDADGYHTITMCINNTAQAIGVCNKDFVCDNGECVALD